MTTRDTIPETWLARRVQVRLVSPSQWGSRLWGITCPGCTFAARIYAPFGAVVNAATSHAGNCRPLRLRSFDPCPRCGGTGEIPGRGHYRRFCGACLGRGWKRLDQEVAA